MTDPTDRLRGRIVTALLYPGSHDRPHNDREAEEWLAALAAPAPGQPDQTDRLREALLEVYDAMSGPQFAMLSEPTRKAMTALARDRSTLGRGRVTNRRTDMRLRENRR